MAERIWGDARNYTSEFGGISTFLLLIVVCIATLLFYPKITSNHRGLQREDERVQDNFFFKMLVLSVAFQFLAIWQANAFRLAMIFHISMLPLLPNVLNKQTKKVSRYLAVSIVVAALCVQLFFITANTSDILPFTFFWQV